MSLTLRDYQREAVEATLQHFRQLDDSACIVLPTGSGKSLIIGELARLARGRVLVLAHVKELCEQNYEKHCALGGQAGLFAAGLGKKESEQRVTFGSVQSVARNLAAFDESYSLLIIDECHRVNEREDSQYGQIIQALRRDNPRLRILGLTATPYRLQLGWIYEQHIKGVVRSEASRPFRRCIYEVTLKRLIDDGYLTPPTFVDAPIAQYDFSALRPNASGNYGEKEVNALLVRHPRVTQAIIEQVVELAETRQGVMVFAATVEHAKEIASYLPNGSYGIVLGETSTEERDEQIAAFRAKKTKYLVNVAVLTTGFDAPHVDLIAVLRPTESVSLFQQIAGRGLRLSEGKKDCLLIDYAGNGISLFHPEVGDKRPNALTAPVSVPCPLCGFSNTFWGTTDAEGRVVEHYGRRCKALIAAEDGSSEQCSYRYRFKECSQCGAENDIAARRCMKCARTMVDPDEQLKQALKLKGAMVMRVAGMTLVAKGSSLHIRYHDEDGAELSERFDLSQAGQRAVFNRVFRRRIGTPHGSPVFGSAEQVCAAAPTLCAPDFVIARKKKHWFNVQERVFDYSGRYRKAGEQ